VTTAADRNREISETWRRLVELPGRWRRSSSQAGGLLVAERGEAGGYFVELDAVPGRRAYLKPLKRHGWRRAAREKIASDLAGEIGVTVPPVLLAVNEAADVERWACVSLLLYPHQFSWSQIRNFLGENESPIAGELASMMAAPAARAFAFDTWLDQTDHNDHPSNIVFGYEGNDYRSGEFIFLDYAFSMGVSGGWANEGFRACHAAPFPPRMCSSLNRLVLEEAVQRIEAFSGAKVEDVVNRIPWQWLPDADKQVIVAGLLERRRLVRGALQSYLRSTA